MSTPSGSTLPSPDVMGSKAEMIGGIRVEEVGTAFTRSGAALSKGDYGERVARAQRMAAWTHRYG